MSTKPPSDTPDSDTPKGDRIAKVLARAGVASRREAERMIEAGRVRVNGAQILSPALNVSESDRITVDGNHVGEPEPPRMWLYHKPTGLVTTNRDEKGRGTIYDDLPEDMPRVVSVGRLDINSEGLLLLTNDGGIKRKLELPATGWLRRYRVRVNGRPSEDALEPLRKGITVDGENFQPMTVTLDRQQGANAWLTIGLREGKNREIRRAMEAVNLSVNRLIRISYGPFQLGELKPGEVEEIRRKTVREQLGIELEDPTGTAVKKPTQVNRGPRRKPGGFGGAGQPGLPRAEEMEQPKRFGAGKPGATGPRDARSAAKSGPRSGPKSGPKSGPHAGFKSGPKPAGSAPRSAGPRPAGGPRKPTGPRKPR
ncbi:23S rRNA pseudouridine2605 synthase [Sulfitobacter brevis]|uniref:Pseudouridine synthase n=1 Tax=Sulfitobacter brevis TaxID=74348 RepID=A0A1I2EJL1_9RHOB|nr:pseudouridine synthase [Sulfitobacter brevis]SFE92706.1 23S rRNA pseudouridine2605 synthase [Sulfitobacter brevis]